MRVRDGRTASHKEEKHVCETTEGGRPMFIRKENIWKEELRPNDHIILS